MGGSVDSGKSSGTNSESHGACSEDFVSWFYNSKVYMSIAMSNRAVER